MATEAEQLLAIKDLLADRLVDALCDGYPRPPRWLEGVVWEFMVRAIADILGDPSPAGVNWLDNYMSNQLWDEARKRTR